jgi:hypothetical protein
LIAALIQDFEISRKVDNICLYLRDFSSHMIYKPASRNKNEMEPLCFRAHLEEELQSGWDVLAWELFSPEVVLVMALTFA